MFFSASYKLLRPKTVQDGAPQLCLLVYQPHELVRYIYHNKNSAIEIRQLNATTNGGPIL